LETFRPPISLLIANSPADRKSRCFRSSPLDPGFRRDEVQDKADPKPGAEKFIRRQAGKGAGADEDGDDRPNGGNSQTYRETANHQFAVRRNFSPQNMSERFA